MKKQQVVFLSAFILSSANVWSHAVEAAPTTSQVVVNQSAAAAINSSSQLVTPTAKQSYAIGVDMGKNLKDRQVNIDTTIFVQGLKDGLAGVNPLMSDQDIQQTIIALQKEIMVRRQAQIDTLKTKNKSAGDAFLSANRTKPGVVTLPDGVQYKVIQAGTGVQPAETDIVTVNYIGTTIDGKEFDNSYKRGKPVSFPLKEMIPGWIEALKLMKVGSTWELYIPANLAYGEQGAPPFVGPNETLIFKVNLIDAKKQ